jgi:hypothetical protein
MITKTVQVQAASAETAIWKTAEKIRQVLT